MPTDLNNDAIQRIHFLTGSPENIINCSKVPPKKPFDKRTIEFLNDLSGILMNNKEAKNYPDIVTFAFWIRKSSLIRMKERYADTDAIRIGRGTAFHIAPSNVPVNFAYSAVAGLLSGNANIVRVSSKEFRQVSIIADSVNKALDLYPDMEPYLSFIRYERDKAINDLLSEIADIRVIWGGNDTIREIKKSPLSTRSVDVLFADRYSVAVIDSDVYMSSYDKDKTALDFYNDTFLTDQNACTSPVIVIWLGKQIEEAKKLFWAKEHELVKRRYDLKPIQAVNKLDSAYLSAAIFPGCRLEKSEDNLIIRVNIPVPNKRLLEYKDNSGFFFEYDCKDIVDIREICDDKQCQTIGYIGDQDIFNPLIETGIKGVDRIVPIGRTLDFDLIWDGYNLIDIMTRIIQIV